MTATTKNLTFFSGGLRLRGTLHLPSASTQPPPVVIGSHGLLATAESAKQIALASECSRIGIAFFRFDHRGCGRSEGDFREVTSLEGRCEDLLAAADLLSSRDDVGSRLGLFGSSMGGTTCLASAQHLDAGPMVIVAAPIRSRSLQQASDALNDPLSGRPPYDVDKMRFDISDRLEAIRHILVFHGEADETVPVSHGREVYQKAGEPKRLIIQEGGDHFMSDETHQKAFARETIAWFARGLL